MKDEIMRLDCVDSVFREILGRRRASSMSVLAAYMHLSAHDTSLAPVVANFVGRLDLFLPELHIRNWDGICWSTVSFERLS